MFFGEVNKILGMNARNLLYIRPSNPRSAVRLADDKLATKKVLRKNKIPTSSILAIFDDFSDLDEFDWTSLPSSFVIKPNQGFGGEGIWVIKGRTKNGWRRSDGTEVSIYDIKDHVLNIFDGNYSLGNVADIGYIERKVKLHKKFKKLTSGGGIPDIRVICYNMVPVMSMLRLPTPESSGKANLHQGAIGVGVEIASGITTKAVWRGNNIRYYPDTHKKLHGIRIPYWREVLEMSSKCQKACGLGYAGIDIVLDEKEGPLVLEVNARPGLEIQNANRMPLKSRLDRVEGLHVSDPIKAVRLARELFGEEIGLEIEKDFGKPVIRSVEEVLLIGKGKKKLRAVAKIDTGAYRTSIGENIAEKLIMEKPLRKKYVKSAFGGEWRNVYDLIMVLQGKRVKTQVFVADRAHMKYDMIIGRRDLKSFLIEPSVRRFGLPKKIK